MDAFLYTAHPARIVFGIGRLQHLAQELDRLPARRALVVTTTSQRQRMAALEEILGNRHAGVFDEAAMHVPVEVAQKAVRAARALDADCVIALGGGSAIGVAKAIALEVPVPILAIPTTYAGSEMTPIYGITEGGLKKTGKDLRTLPRTVIYDPGLSSTLPVDLSIKSAFNAMAHGIEGMYAQDRNPITSLMAQEGIQALAQAIRRIADRPDDLQTRSQALYGAWLCGSVLGQVGMALHHKLCHTLGGSFDFPHADVHTIVLPHAMAYNAPAEPDVMRRIASILGTPSAAGGLYDLMAGTGVPKSLKALGMAETDLDRAADLAMSAAYWNPRPLERTAIRALLQHAWEGIRPTDTSAGPA